MAIQEQKHKTDRRMTHVIQQLHKAVLRARRVARRTLGGVLRLVKRIGGSASTSTWELIRPAVVKVGLATLRSATRVIDRFSPPRSLYAGTPIISISTISRAERLLGVHADTLVWHPYFLTNAFTYKLGKMLDHGPPWWRRVVPFLVLLWACLRYKRFHFFYDRGILQPDWRLGRLQFREDELKLLKFLGKDLFFYAYGADVRTEKRTRALGALNCCTECPAPGAGCICVEEEGIRNYERITRYATAMFSMGDMIEYTPGSRNDLFYWPIDLTAEEGRRYAPRYPDADSGLPIRVVHAPNHRGFKGTHYLIEAVEKLQAEGIPFELILVERVPNREALEIYRTADIIFDQCMIGFHGYFALEAMAMGKPVMVFIRDPERYLLQHRECPFINAPADQVESVLRGLSSDRTRLREIGLQGRRYIEKFYSMPAYAKRLRRTYYSLGVAA